MEKQSKLKNKILSIIPKSGAVTFQNLPFSPGRDHKVRSESVANRWFKTHGGTKGFSGPMIPDEARRKPKDGGIETQEPTSPKISCMGQIKQKKKQIKKDKARNNIVGGSDSSTPRDKEEKEKNNNNKQGGSRFQLPRMFYHAAKPKTTRKKSSNTFASAVEDRSAPPLGHMRRFASGRETFSNFDWKAQIAPEERDCFSEDERMESDAEEDVIIPFSAPIMPDAPALTRSSSTGQPRKEINLWKRRTMAPPRPLQLNPVLTAK